MKHRCAFPAPQFVALLGLAVLMPALAAAASASPQIDAPKVSPGFEAARSKGGAPSPPAGRNAGEMIMKTPLPLPAGARITLKQAVAIAVKYHPRAKEAAAQSGAADERVGEARAFLGPQLYGIAEYLRSTDNGIGNTSYYNPGGLLPRMTGRNHDLASGDFSQSWDTADNYVAGVAVTQHLFDFGRRRGFVAERRFQAAATKEEEKLVSLDLIFGVSLRYFHLLQAKQLVRVYEKAVEERRFHLHEAKVKADAGLRPELDVYVTQAEVQRAELHLVDARNSEENARVAFDNALGLGGREPNYQLADVLTYGSITDRLAALLQEALQLRPDMKALADQARAMGAKIVQARSDYWPTATAVAGYSTMGTGTPPANNVNVGVVLVWPIFNSYLTSHQVSEAKLSQKAVESHIEDLRQRIILQVKTAFLDWQASLKRIHRAKETLEASRVQLELAEKRYSAGLADIVELEDAQRSYTNDDAAYANALYGFSLAKAAVDRATARSLAALEPEPAKK